MGYEFVNKISAPRSNQPIFLEVFGTHCGPCKAMVPHLAEFVKRFPNVYIISACSEDFNAIKKFVEDNPKCKEYNVAQDKGGYVSSLMKRVGQNGIPHSFAFDKEGKLIWHGHPNEAASYLRSLNDTADTVFQGKGRKL